MAVSKKAIRVGLAGNPNSGKTTLFNALTGAHQKVGNYAGVTVEKKEGRTFYKGREIVIFDLPGTYSLTAYSADEVVARDFLLQEKPDVILNVLDSTNIERNLYFCLQLRELGIPVVGALNIIDQAESLGIGIDEQLLGDLLQMPLVKTVAAKKTGIIELLEAVIAVADTSASRQSAVYYGDELEREISKLVKLIGQDGDFVSEVPARWLAIKLLEKDADAQRKLQRHSSGSTIAAEARRHIEHMEKHFGRDAEIIVTEQRYAYVHGAVSEAVQREERPGATPTEKVDRFLLNRYLELPVFILLLWSIFQLTFIVGEYPKHWLEEGFKLLSVALDSVLPDGLLRSLLVDGIVGGVGAVLSFVPLIIIMFTLISLLEDTGYMARAAFIMDKFLHVFGLHGQSFLPLMLGFGCSVPAIMATRTLRSQKDRILTIIVTPFMSCGAKLPVYILLAGAFFPDNAGNVVMLIYGCGIFLAMLSAAVLRRTVFKGKSTPFVMELPPYRLPTVRGITWHVWDKTRGYFRKAGTIILFSSVLIWAATTFPQTAYDDGAKAQLTERIMAEQSLNREAAEKAADVAIGDEQMKNSIAGRLGNWLEPVIRPAGFDWEIGVATITGFAAKEVVVSTLAVLHRTESGEADGENTLGQALKGDPDFSPLVAFTLMLFTLINIPCVAALATIRAEIGWRWLLFGMTYYLLLAWTVSVIVYQVGIRTGF